MQRNHRASALLRGCRQVPDWWTVGGRGNPYAIEFVGLGSGSQFYSKATAGLTAGNETITMWVKPQATIVHGVRYGLFGIYDSGLGFDVYSLELVGDTTNGNTLDLSLLGTSIGTHTNLGTNWVNITLIFTGGVAELWVNGTLSFSASASYGGAVTNHTIGYVTPQAPKVPAYLNEVIVDEIAFFDTPLSAVTLYNSGVPVDYGDAYPSLVASYEVERPTGSISSKYIFPRYYPSGSTPASFVFGGTTSGVVEVTTSALRSSDTNAFKAMAAQYKDWVYGTAVGGKTPLGAGVDLTDLACGFMVYPPGGGFSTLGYSGAYTGNAEVPYATPQASKATTMVSEDSTAYPASGGTGSLTEVTDARAGRIMLPLFVKR